MSRLADVTVVDDGTHRWHLYTSTEEEKKMREHEDHKQKEANSPAGNGPLAGRPDDRASGISPCSS